MEQIARAVKKRIGKFEFNHDDQHVRCSAIKTSLDYLELAYGRKHVDKLISILKRVIGNNSFTRKYLFDEHNWVSYETYQAILLIGRSITKDDNFCYNAGLNFFKFNKGGIITLGKYLGSPQSLYKNIPEFIKKYNNQINVNVVEVFNGRARITMSLKKKFRDRAKKRLYFHKNGCDLVKGILQGIPTLFDFPQSEVFDVKCLAKGDNLCEWIFVWKKTHIVKRYFDSIVARNYKNLMKEQNHELSTSISRLESTCNELREKNQEILGYQEKLIEKEKLESAVSMLSGIAHDIKNPLALISGYAQLLTDESTKKENIIDYSNLILKQSERTVLIIQDLLSDIKGTLPSLNKESIDVNKFILTFSSELKPGYQSGDIKIILDIKATKKTSVIIDSNHFGRVFYNICKNAKEAMPNGGLLTISTYINKDNLFVSFQDTGTGIPKEKLKTIFRRFVSYKENGSGLGMGIVKNLVEAHKGGIEVSSKIGKGTNVVIKLPLKTE